MQQQRQPCADEAPSYWLRSAELLIVDHALADTSCMVSAAGPESVLAWSLPPPPSLRWRRPPPTWRPCSSWTRWRWRTRLPSRWRTATLGPCWWWPPRPTAISPWPPTWRPPCCRAHRPRCSPRTPPWCHRTPSPPTTSCSPAPASGDSRLLLRSPLLRHLLRNICSPPHHPHLQHLCCHSPQVSPRLLLPLIPHVLDTGCSS